MKMIPEVDTFLDAAGKVTTDPEQAAILLARAGREIAPALIKRHNLIEQMKGGKGAPQNKSEMPALNKADAVEVEVETPKPKRSAKRKAKK